MLEWKEAASFAAAGKIKTHAENSLNFYRFIIPVWNTNRKHASAGDDGV